MAETWTSHAVSNIDNGDLLMSFWFKSLPRLNSVVPLQGHIDVSPGLVALNEIIAPETQYDWSFGALTVFMRPFSWPLWGCLVLVVLLSGVTDYIIERRHSKEARIQASIYEYAAGFLWGGFHRPLSVASTFYQVLLGFMLLIMVAMYTAELAAWVTLSATSQLSVTSVNEAMSNNKALCMEEGCARHCPRAASHASCPLV